MRRFNTTGDTAAMRPGTLRAWRLAHSWASLICTLFLLILCVTGLPLIFSDGLDAIGSPRHVAGGHPARSPPSLDEEVSRTLAHIPGYIPQSLSWQEDRIVLRSAPVPLAEPATYSTTIIDRATGSIIASRPARITVVQILLAFHRELFLGLPGMILLGIMGLLFVLAIVSGVILYGPFTHRLDFGAVRAGRSSRVRWLDLHNLLGIVTLAWASVVGLTGAMNTLADPLFAAWRNQDMPTPATAANLHVLPRSLASLDHVVGEAEQMLPGTKPESLAFPYSRYGGARQYILWMQGATPLTARIFTPVVIDAVTGRIVSVRQLPWYLRAIEVSRPLHFGDYGEMPLKVIWALLDLVTIVVLGSGLYLWIGKRRRAPAGASRKGPMPAVPPELLEAAE